MSTPHSNNKFSERFIPFRRSDIVNMCIEDGALQAGQIEQFKSFCDLLCGIFHYRMHRSLETLKDCYAPFNPDIDTTHIQSTTTQQKSEYEKRLERELTTVLNQANFERISENEVNQALQQESLFKVKLHIDFNDFEEVLFFRRGVSRRTETLRLWLGLKKKEIDVTVYERVVIYVRFKDQEYFKQQERSDLLFEPGTSLIKLFRNVPKNDLEMLFPNTEIRMKPIDKLIIGVPTAVGGLFMLVTKLGSTLLLVFAVIAFWLGIRSEPATINQATLIALTVGLGGLGGFLWRQFTKYKNRKIQFMKQLAENLYHKNLDNNAGVFFNIIDAAEEEECKETILAYYHLLISKHAQDKNRLDENIEQWFKNKYQCEINFEVDDAIKKLEQLGLISLEENKYRAIGMEQANRNLDKQWDEIFMFNN